MKKIEPYKSVEEALQSLDNGGRFYNLFTKAKDGIISKAELGKVGGTFGDKQRMILFLELAIDELSEGERTSIVLRLEKELYEAYQQHKSQHLDIDQIQEEGQIDHNVIIHGVPKKVESKEEFTGFMMMPQMTNNMMTMVPIPIIDSYDVYEIRGNKPEETAFIAQNRDGQILSEKPMKFGGILRAFKKKADEASPQKKYLEAVYRVELDA